MRRWVISALIAAMAIGLFLWRYGSYDPCDWLMQDVAANTGVPLNLVSGMMRKRLKGQEPTATQCFEGWVELHTKGLQPFRN